MWILSELIECWRETVYFRALVICLFIVGGIQVAFLGVVGVPVWFAAIFTVGEVITAFLVNIGFYWLEGRLS